MKHAGSTQTWSAYVDVVSADGQSALIIRVSHDPAAGRAELWVHLFLEGRMFAHMSAHACPPLGASVTGDDQQHCRLDLAAGHLNASVLASETESCEFGAGSIPLQINLHWSCVERQGSNLRGRDERLVKVVAQARIENRICDLTGWGHQHTQLQEQPRFAQRFTYLSLRGDDIGFVGLLTGAFQRGFGVCRGETLTTSSIHLDPIAASRRIVIQNASLSLEGTLTRTYSYWIPMGGTRRYGSIVTGDLAGLSISGVLNDFAGPAP